jgi:hypothetical protein
MNGPDDGEQFGYKLTPVHDLDGDGVELVEPGDASGLTRPVGRAGAVGWQDVDQNRDLSVSAGDLDDATVSTSSYGRAVRDRWTDDGHGPRMPSLSAGFSRHALGRAVDVDVLQVDGAVLSDLDGSGIPELAMAPDDMGAPYGGVLRIYRR